MLDKTFALEILTPRRKVFSGQAVSLVAPGEIGSLGILANHAPLVTSLVPGKVVVRESAGGAPRTFHSKGSGFLEVIKNQAVVLVDEMVEGEEHGDIHG